VRGLAAAMADTDGTRRNRWLLVPSRVYGNPYAISPASLERAVWPAVRAAAAAAGAKALDLSQQLHDPHGKLFVGAGLDSAFAPLEKRRRREQGEERSHGGGRTNATTFVVRDSRLPQWGEAHWNQVALVSDGVHPNANGADVIAHAVAEAFLQRVIMPSLI
jgi:lysophospholipase L1-like esterase